MTRGQLRAWARERRRAISPEARLAEEARLFERLTIWSPYRQAKTVFLFASVGDEADTRAIIDDALQKGMRVLLPRCKQHGIMEAVEFSGWRGCRPGPYGIPEPESGEVVPRGQIDFILVPGLLFDGRGYRLGQGGGYYDRYLAGFSGTSCGIAFDAQVVPELPVAAHDVAVRALATPSYIRLFEGGTHHG